MAYLGVHGAAPHRRSTLFAQQSHAPRQPGVKANLSINEMLSGGYPLSLPVIAALRPIRTWNDLFSDAFI